MRFCAVQGVVPEHFARASGGLIRHILQQLEEIGFVEKNPGSHGGRRITSQVGARDGASNTSIAQVPHICKVLRLSSRCCLARGVDRKDAGCLLLAFALRIMAPLSSV